MKPVCMTMAISFLLAAADSRCTDAGTIRIDVSDADGRPMPCRVHLADKEGQPVQAPGQPFWRDHFVCSGQLEFGVAPGNYSWVIERGPEYQTAGGRVRVGEEATVAIKVRLKRITELRREGWYSGDLHVHRPVKDVPLLMRAEDVDFAPVITWWNQRGRENRVSQKTDVRFDGHRIYQILAGEDEREGGALLYFGLKKPIDLSVKSREFPSPMKFVREARESDPNVWIDIEKPFWWDVPAWLASGQMNSIGLANNHMCRSRMYESEAWGRPRDESRLPAPRGNGFWTQEIYYHLLNSGLRLPPSAGSASGVLPNPVGYNRVYVHLDKPFSRESWFDGLSQGRCFVTNGPLLRVTANGQLPGAVFKAGDRPQPVELVMQLTSNDRVKRLEVIVNGRVALVIPCEKATDQRKTAKLTLSEPGWFLVRAIADVEHTFRFASTAPWYVESEAVKHRISRKSAQFFLDWVDERIERVRKNVSNPDELRAILEPHEDARVFWVGRVESATAD